MFVALRRSEVFKSEGESRLLRLTGAEKTREHSSLFYRLFHFIIAISDEVLFVIMTATRTLQPVYFCHESGYLDLN